MVLLQAWNAYRGGMGGAGPLPCSGGLLEQPACVMASFAIMSATANALRKKEG